MHSLNRWTWRSSAGAKPRRNSIYIEEQPKSSGIWWLQVPTETRMANGLKIGGQIENYEAVRHPKSISPLWQKTDLFLIQIFSLNRIKLNIEGLENPSELGTVILFWIWSYGAVRVLNTGGIGFNPLSSHFRELAGRIIALKRH